MTASEAPAQLSLANIMVRALCEARPACKGEVRISLAQLHRPLTVLKRGLRRTWSWVGSGIETRRSAAHSTQSCRQSDAAGLIMINRRAQAKDRDSGRCQTVLLPTGKSVMVHPRK